MNISTFCRKAALLFVLFSAFYTFAQTGLKVIYYDGTEQGFSVADSGKLYFSESNLMIQAEAGASATSIPTSIIQKIIFDNSVLSVQNVSQTTSKYILYPNPSNDFIRIKSLSGDKIETYIYSADGKLLHKGNYSSDQNIDISSLKSGVYLIKANSQTFKLIKK